jgi:hypothetical protein
MQHIGLRRQTENGEVLALFDAEGLDLRIVKRAPPCANMTCYTYP